MDRISDILKHPNYLSAMKKINRFEEERIFCKHALNHQLDVGRIAYIISLEKGLGIEKDIIYAIALLHDIGKYLQYQENIPHNEASAQLAEVILSDCGYDEKERNIILKAIYRHRKMGLCESQLEKIIYQADKLSRNCFHCGSKEECNWTEDKKNKGITW